jgi:4-hydroxy-tetrahydrodipicolinate synthase
MSKTIEGIIVPMITPFKKNGELDLELAREEIRLLIKAGVHGISPGGSTGEGAALDDDEITALIRLIRECAGDMLIVAGVIRNSTKAAVRTALSAKAAGADALMVTPVSYNVLVPDDEGNINYYRSISEAVDLPIVIYNVVPQNTISPVVFNSLLEIKNITGIKQSCGGIAAFYEMKMCCGHRGKIFSATDEMMYTTFELGADGAISAILTVFPEACVEMWNLSKSGGHGRGLELQNRLYHVWRTISGNQFPIRIKHALRLMGRNPGFPRSPICHMDEEEKQNIEKELKKVGFIK